MDAGGVKKTLYFVGVSIFNIFSIGFSKRVTSEVGRLGVLCGHHKASSTSSLPSFLITSSSSHHLTMNELEKKLAAMRARHEEEARIIEAEFLRQRKEPDGKDQNSSPLCLQALMRD